jgi:hypothetical protein
VYEEWCGPGHNGAYRNYLNEAEDAVNTVLQEQEQPVPPPSTGTASPSPLWIVPLLAVPLGFAGAGFIFMSRKNMSFNDVKLLVKEKFGRWSSHGK